MQLLELRPRRGAVALRLRLQLRPCRIHQRWRGPLREAFDWLRDTVAPKFEAIGRISFKDPWAARDAYIGVILDRSPSSIDAFLQEHGTVGFDDSSRATALQLMELQRHAMLMYTSCAWFFDDVAGIETVQVIQYAARVIQLAQRVLGLELEAEFLERLAQAHGSTKEAPDGRAVYERTVRPAILSLKRVAAHYGVHRLFDAQDDHVYAFDIEAEEGTRSTYGRAKLVVGNAMFRSRIDLDAARLSYCALHFGDHTVSCGVRAFAGPEAFAQVSAAAHEAFQRAAFPEVLKLMDRDFDGTSYSIGSLFRDEQHTVVRRILKPALEQIDNSYRQIYEQNAPLTRFLRSLDLTVPRRIQMTGAFVLSQGLRQALEAPVPDLARVEEIIDEATQSGIELDQQTIGMAVSDAMDRAIRATDRNDPLSNGRWLLDLVKLIAKLPFAVDLWPLQEHFVDHMRSRIGPLVGRSDAASTGQLALIRELGTALEVQV